MVINSFAITMFDMILGFGMGRARPGRAAEGAQMDPKILKYLIKPGENRDSCSKRGHDEY